MIHIVEIRFSMEERIMKKRTVKLFVCAALMSLSLSATACGGSDSGAKGEDAATEAPAPEEEANAEEEVKEEAPAEEEAPEESSGQKTLEEYLKEDPEAEKQLEEQATAQGNDQMDMAIEVVGNDVICVATFKDSIELPEGTAETLEAGMNELESAFSAFAGVLDDAIGAEKGTVSYGVRYCDSDGNVLAEASFRAQ